MNKDSSKILLQKMIVGHYVEEIPKDNNKKIMYIMQGDGLWQVRNNVLGNFTIHMCEMKIPGLKNTLKEGWELSVPLIPNILKEKAISFFEDVCKKYETEAYLQFFYDTKTKEYILHCPRQVISGASVKYFMEEKFSDKVFVLEMHSHAKMGAFFSSTDDADEKSDRFFGVVGNLDKFQHTMKFRLMIGGIPIDIEYDDIFEKDAKIDYPEVWMERIEKQKPRLIKLNNNFISDIKEDDVKNFQCHFNNFDNQQDYTKFQKLSDKYYDDIEEYYDDIEEYYDDIEEVDSDIKKNKIFEGKINDYRKWKF